MVQTLLALCLEILDSRAMPMSLLDVLDAWEDTWADLSGYAGDAQAHSRRIPRQVLAECLSQHLHIMRGRGGALESRIARHEALSATLYLDAWLRLNDHWRLGDDDPGMPPRP